MSRQYDIVVFGATGYTGKLTAQAIAKSLPTSIRWAVAGRRYEKLEAVVSQCQSLNSACQPPAIEVCSLDDVELANLARKTKILVSTVGPYSIHGEPAFKACAENGTHYFDVTGEVAFIKKMIDKYESTAKTSGAIMIPQIGVESAPADLITFSLVSKIRQELSVPTAEVVLSLHDLAGTPSGGTLATILALNEQFSPSELLASSRPYALSPLPGPVVKSSASWVGSRTVADLGMLTTSFTGVVDKPCVQRSWGLLGGPKLYGPNFNLECMMRTRNYFTGMVIHFGLFVVAVGLALAPFRWLAKKLVIEAGQGASEDDMKKERCEYRAIATPDLPGETKKAFSKVIYRGSMYQRTFLAQACLTLLRDDSVASKSGGGILTPATLGQPFIDRLAAEGFAIETEILNR